MLNTETALKLVEVDLPLSLAKKQLKGSIVRPNSPSRVRIPKSKRSKSFKQFIVEDLLSLIRARSKTPVSARTPRLVRKTSKSPRHTISVKRESSLRNLPEPKYAYAARSHLNPQLNYDSLRDLHYYPSSISDNRRTPDSMRPHKPIQNRLGKITARPTPVGRNSIFYKGFDSQASKSASELRLLISKSRLHKHV